jgi:LacI family transcriptional regulator
MVMAVKKFVTQKDIARACNVSRSTVAAVIRNEREAKMMPEATRNMIWDAIRNMGYRPNAAARSLMTGRTHTVTLAIQNYIILEGAVTSRILQGIGEEAQRLNYSVNICKYQAQPDLKATFHSLFRESRFDGVFFYGAEGFEQEIREDILKDLNRPYVILEKTAIKSPCVVFDSYAGGKMVTEHLISHNRKKIAYIGSDHPRSTFGQRFAGYLDAMKVAGLPKSDKLIYPIEDDYKGIGYRGVTKFLENKTPFDAIVCSTDITAMSAIQTLNQHGLRVSEDIAVTGYDDSPLAELSIPALTSVQQDGIEMGRQAMRLLYELIMGEKESDTPTIILPVNLVVRRSCGCKNSTNTD